MQEVVNHHVGVDISQINSTVQGNLSNWPQGDDVIAHTCACLQNIGNEESSPRIKPKIQRYKFI